MVLSFFFAGLAVLIHLAIFYFESLAWGSPKVNKIFGVDEKTAEANRLFAFNQGFYNLFLAATLFVGGLLAMFLPEVHKPVGWALMAAGALSMMGAAMVLISSSSRLWRASLIQGIPPFLALIFLGGTILV